MRRRSFLAGASAVLGTLTAARADAGTPNIPRRKLERLALSSSSYRANYDGRYAVAAALPRLSHTTFPAFARKTFGLHKVELWDQQFGPGGASLEACRAVRIAADRAGVTIVNIEVEDLPNLGPADPVARDDAIAACRAWLDKARILGAGSIRVNVSRRQDPVDLPSAIATLRAAADYGRSIGVCVQLENHGGQTARISDLIAMVRAVDHDYCRIEIDWGSWTLPGDRYPDILAAMPYVHMVSAKGERFDETDYRHTSFDVQRLVREAEAAGFKGVYSIELFATPAPADTARAVRSFIQMISDGMA